MPYLLGPKYSPDFVGRPPHMPPRDYALWLAWIPTVRAQLRALYFDVNLGEGRKAPNVPSPELASMWYKLTTKRADVVALSATHAWLVELHDPAGATSIGRLQVYRTLWQKDPPFPLPLRTMLITSGDDPDVRELAAQVDVEYHVVRLSRFSNLQP